MELEVGIKLEIRNERQNRTQRKGGDERDLQRMEAAMN